MIKKYAICEDKNRFSANAQSAAEGIILGYKPKKNILYYLV